MRKILSILLATVILLTLVIPTSAALPGNDIIPLWENISSIKTSISFDGTDGLVTCQISGNTGTTVVGNLRIFKQTSSGGWSLVKIDSASSVTRTLTFDTDFTAVSGAYYKAVLTVHVTKNDVVETVTKTSYKTCP